MKAGVERFRAFYGKHFIAFELGFAVLLTTLAFRLYLFYRIGPWPDDTVYAALVASFAALLGFAITGVSVILAFSGSRELSLLRKSKYFPMTFRVFINASIFLGLGFVFSFLGLVLDVDTLGGEVVFYLNVFALVASAFMLSRCIWVLSNLVAITTGKNEKDGAKSQRP